MKGKHRARKENAAANFARPRHLPPGSPQLSTHPQNISGQVPEAGQRESPLPQCCPFPLWDRRTVRPGIPDSTWFNWKQESIGQTWAWGDDDNEKVTGLSRQKGACGGGSRGEEGAPQAGKAPWEHRHVRGSTGM